MASTLDSGLYATIRDVPLSSYSRPRPPQAKPINHLFGRDYYSRQNKNIWQGTSQFADHKFGDDESIASHDNDRTVTTDKSNSGLRGPDIVDHNTGALAGGGAHVTSSSSASALSSRPPSSLVSPTRLRNNGGLGSEASNSMNNPSRPSLLPGSAPDIEPSDLPVSRLTLHPRQTSTIGRGFGHFQVGEAEEFVPSYLRDHEQSRQQLSIIGTGEASGFEHGVDGAAMADSDHRRTSFQTDSGFQSREAVNPFRAQNGMSSFRLLPDDLMDRQAPGLGFDNNQSMITIANQSNSYDMRDGRDNGFRIPNKVSTHRNPSNLRPEVASYKPSSINTNPGPYNYQQYSVVEGTDVSGLASYTAVNNVRTRALNQQAMTISHNPLSNNPFNGNVPSYGDQDGSRQRMADNFVNGGSDRYSNPRHVTPPGLRVNPTGLNNISRYQESAAQHSFETRPFDSMSDMVQTIPNEQPYILHPTMGPPEFHADSFYSSEPEAKSSTRSEKLERFRADNKNRKYELKEIFGHIVEFSGDQTGSRFIQTKLEQANSDEKEQIFAELKNDARQLMTDVFGNYVIQKMFEYGNQSQKRALAHMMQGNVMKLSLHAYGCRCVQKAFEHILTDQQAQLIRELQDSVLCVAESQHGNHVIQKAIECIPGEHVQFIVDAHRTHVVRLSRNIYGCRIIQRMLEYCAPNTKRGILDELHLAIPSLIDDQYGNYVIQCIIKKCGANDRYRVIEHVRQRLLYYSMHKFASNVVEKAIQYAAEDQRVDIIRRLTGPDLENGMASPVLPLLKDQYGNYVIQTVLRTMNGPARKMLAEEVRQHLSHIGKVSRSKQITAMSDTLAAITAGHSPSSVGTGAQTPLTPTSVNGGGNMGTPLSKAIEIAPQGYTMRELHCSTMPFKPAQY